MEDVLRHYVDAAQSDWAALLPLVEFAINDSWQESIQAIPFAVVYGRRPSLPMDSILRGEEGNAVSSLQCDSAYERALLIAEEVKNAKSAMDAAQQRQKAYADSKRREVQFDVGQEVLLSTTNIKPKFKGSAKLLPKWIGPFKVTEVINPVAFRLKLPETLKLHDVFHASLLKPYLPDGNVQPPPPPELLEDEFEYEVEAVLSHRFKRGDKLEYLIRWKGYGHEHDTWETEENCSNSSDLITEYWNRVKVQTEKKPVSKRKSKKRARQAADAATESLSGYALRSSKRRR
jgi:hypothetical protein